MILLGHSFGGTLALEYAARHPEHVAGLIFVDGLPDAPAAYRVWRRELERRHPEWIRQRDGADFAVVMQAMQQGDPKAFFDSLQFRDARFLALQDSVDAGQWAARHG